MIGELSRFISLVRLKIRFVMFLNWLLELLIYTSIPYILGYFFGFNLSYLYLLIPFATALSLSIFRSIPDKSVAIIIDRDLDLKERVITSLEFGREESFIIKTLINETVILLKNLNIKKVYPLRFRERLKYVAIIPPVLFFSLMFYQNVFYPRFISFREEMTTQAGIETDILRLEQKLVSEKPELAKRLELLRREMEEKKVKNEEGLSVLKEITKEIEKDPGSMDTSTRVDIKRMLEMVMEKMNSKISQNNQNNEKEQREERQLTSDRNSSGEGRNSGTENFPTKDRSNLDSKEGVGKDSSMGEENFDTMSNTGEDKKSGNITEGGSQGEMDTASKEGKEGREAKEGSNNIEQGGTLPGKGERENKLGEESQRRNLQGLPQYVPGIPKEEGDIKLKIRNVGKDISPSIGERDTGTPERATEEPVKKELVPSEYRETIKLYFERLKGE